jgi:hypothetical protein
MPRLRVNIIRTRAEHLDEGRRAGRAPGTVADPQRASRTGDWSM